MRLLVSDIATDSIEHARFDDLPRWLSPGDLLVVNTSGTLNAALPATTEDGRRIRAPSVDAAARRILDGRSAAAVRPAHRCRTANARAGSVFEPAGGGRATLLAPYPFVDALDAPSRLWIAAVQFPGPALPYLERHGFPIRYGYVTQPWPSAMYQTVFATEPRQRRNAVCRTAVHAGARDAARLPRRPDCAAAAAHRRRQPEDHEPPYEEFYRVPRDTAERANAARRAGHRVIAVGTTVVRALETVTDETGTTFPGEGWTSLVITPERPVRSVTGLITGLHEPRATHLMMLEQVVAAAAAGTSICGPCHLKRAYAEAQQAGYLWHEFGDGHLILGGGRSLSVAPWPPDHLAREA